MQLTAGQAIEYAVSAEAKGDLTEAERLYREALRLHPHHAEANHKLGLIALNQGNLAEALEFFRNALEADPNTEPFWLSYIQCLIADEQVDEAKKLIADVKRAGIPALALQDLEKQLALAVSDSAYPNKALTPSPPRNKKAHAKKSKAKKKGSKANTPTKEEVGALLEFFQHGKLQQAEKLAVRLTREFPNHPLGWRVLGRLRLQSGRSAEALSALQQALRLAPKDPLYYVDMGGALLKLARLKEAQAVFQKAVSLEPGLAIAHSSLGNAFKQLGKLDEALGAFTKAIQLNPNSEVTHNNLGNVLGAMRRHDEAISSYTQALSLNSNFAEAHVNLGRTYKALGRLNEAEESISEAIALDPNFAIAHNNLGNVLQELGRREDAEVSYLRAVELNSNLADAWWNLVSCSRCLEDAAHRVQQCLIADTEHRQAKLTSAALAYYQGDRSQFDKLTQSEWAHDPYMRSFSWAFSLPKLPNLYFNKWSFFDAVIELSIKSRPFYEFGVWRGSSFKYLIQTFKKGVGFDTFSGLPEQWKIGERVERQGSYSSDGAIPDIPGGEFIAGTFESSLPKFFSEIRPTASLINFDADLYSSTLCALTYSRPIIDQHTILVFDEFIMNESWEEDEYKALNEFCEVNQCSYETLAISFFTKQVAVKLIGI